MRFTTVFTSVLALAAGANAAVSASDMKNNIDQITDVSADTNDIAKSLSVTNMFQKAPEVIESFKRIIVMVTKDISAMNDKRSLQARQECLNVKDIEGCLEGLGEIIEDPGEILGSKRDVPDLGKTLGRKRQSPDYNDMEQNQICGAFRGFVQVHQELLKTIIGKHGLLSLTPFTQPIAAVLRTLEVVVDTIAFSIIDTVPTCAEGATNDKSSLDDTLTDALDTYN
ncbi:uncharacterized protein EURHEDRAFT_524286 [Aspergillus ruber CBS 135680]|uniref:Cell wall galactomannoprotein n=1 Tax=Aspergillus ruber (strain CBS 135680) TaxID=1388766 RepID=A0A017SAC0_ASPRC|nr:uncharacterized protein EURHEDRAFT_524286 [Aspergillus ruber CBS 135680]EYE93766.1 hypothetical protein EURHEDRAFT_524286 [Aspergillus ruber CBS 135680]